MPLQAVDAASRNADRYYRLMGGATPGKAEDAERMARAFKVWKVLELIASCAHCSDVQGGIPNLKLS